MRTISLRFFCVNRDFAKKALEYLKKQFEGYGEIYQGLLPMDKHEYFNVEGGYEITHQIDCMDEDSWKKALVVASSFMHASVVKSNFPDFDASVCVLSGTLFGEGITELEKQLFYNLTRFTSEVNAGMIVVRSKQANDVAKLQEQISHLSEQVASLLAVNSAPRFSILNSLVEVCEHIGRPDIMELLQKSPSYH